MNCPTCNRPAATRFQMFFLYRLIFSSSTGLSFKESLQGKIKCNNCGTILKIVRSQKAIWLWIATMLVFILLYILLFRYILNLIGFNWGIALFIILLFFIAITFGLISRKMDKIETCA
jgi:hypothetical protein